MTERGRDRLYSLLPAVHRVRDVAQGEPLRALLGVVAPELDGIEADTATLYDNWFIETCQEWVVSYIGDLLGVRPIRSVESARVSLRGYVANTLAYRRRKGTTAVLEQLARDTTGWPARAVEFFARLTTTQHVNHVRPAPPATAAIRDAEAAELAGSPFDPLSHTAEVRRIASGRGRHNIPNVGIFLWRLQSYPVGRGGPGVEPLDLATARRVAGPGGTYFTFHPVGLDAPLFNLPRTEQTITHLAEEENVPGRLRRLALHEELEALRRGGASAPRFMSDTAPAFRVWVELAEGGPRVEIPREGIFVCEIPDELELASPPAYAVAVAPEAGRLSFSPSLDPHRVFVMYSYGFGGDLGGGPYDRTESIEQADRIPDADAEFTLATSRRGFLDRNVWQVGVSHLLAPQPGRIYGTLREAVQAWEARPPGTTAGVIAVMDSLSEFDAGLGPIEIEIGEGTRLLVAAADWPLEEDPQAPGTLVRIPGHLRAEGLRPHLVAEVVVRGTAPAGSPDPGELLLNGLLLEGSLTVADGHLGLLALEHCTLVPDRGGVTVLGANERLRLVLRRSICGPLSVPFPIRRIEVTDCILDGAGGSPGVVLQAGDTEAVIERSTVLGGARVQVLHASDCIFDGPVYARRRQTGCVRFSYAPLESELPRRYRCQPDTEVAGRIAAAREEAARTTSAAGPPSELAIRREVAAVLVPQFTSRDYGDPGYGQLARRCPAAIRTGAESGAEMGAFSFLEQPQREANLRGVLDEYLRLGLEAGLFYVT
jgi:hypothetical protein